MVEEITDQNFAEETDNGVVLTDFWATWCGPCSVMSPLVDEVAKEQKDRLVVGKLNCDESMDIAQRYGITGIPAFLIFKDGEVVDKVMGAMPKGELLAAVEKYL